MYVVLFVCAYSFLLQLLNRFRYLAELYVSKKSTTNFLKHLKKSRGQQLTILTYILQYSNLHFTKYTYLETARLTRLNVAYFKRFYNPCIRQSKLYLYLLCNWIQLGIYNTNCNFIEMLVGKLIGFIWMQILKCKLLFEINQFSNWLNTNFYMFCKGIE